MLDRGATYADLVRGFRWTFPARLNMAAQVCDDWAARMPDRLCILDLSEGRERVSYGRLYGLSRRVEAVLARRGVRAGDRVGVLLSQSALCAAAHIAAWRMGAISVPLFKLFREDALRSRLEDSGARVVVTDIEGAGMLAPFDVSPVLRSDLPDEEPDEGSDTPLAGTGPDTPAVLIYTSGTTGKPKGALHGHRVLTGHLPGVELSHDLLRAEMGPEMGAEGMPGMGPEVGPEVGPDVGPEVGPEIGPGMGPEDDMLWTPADWAWIGGLFDVLMPGLALGVPVVASRVDKFSPDLLAQRVADGVRNVFLPPTALRMLKAEGVAVRGLRSVASGGEPLGAEMLAWGRDAFGVTINEFYGQTECNMVASSCGALFPARPGCIGRAVPGFEVAVIDAAGQVTQGEGDIAVRRGAGSMMLGYWQNPQATADKFRGDWLVTGDRGVIEDGYVRFVGREDDVITSAGYRIGPAEIEDCLLTHPGVATVGVVGKPDALRTEIVKAYVVRKPGALVTAEEVQDWVRTRLAGHSYPREVAFVDALPMTVTGKVIRKELKRRAAEEGV